MALENSIIKLLPDSKELGPGVTSEDHQSAVGEKLIELINGGAVLFFKHGFKQTVFQEYYIDSTQYINLEIYQMEKPLGAKGIFLARTDTSDQKLLIGELGYRSDYYCSFYRYNYYVTVTGSDSTKAIQKILRKSAEIVDRKIIGDN